MPYHGTVKPTCGIGGAIGTCEALPGWRLDMSRAGSACPNPRAFSRGRPLFVTGLFGSVGGR